MSDLADIVGSVENDQRERFGWTHLEVDAAREGDTVVLRGTVLVPRVASAIRDALSQGTALDVDASRVRVLDPDDWHAGFDSCVELLRLLPTAGRRRTLATEQLPEDGPVQRLGQCDEFTLVRTVDGTIGWTDATLGAAVQRPLFDLEVTDAPGQFVAAARAYLGTTYRLGGATDAAIDCSALVKRAARRALGVVLPRHSADQLSIAPAPGPGSAATGDLVFVWTPREALCHVGIATGEGAIVHASRSRGTVEDPIADYTADSPRVRHVLYAEVLGLGARAQGHTTLATVLPIGR